LKADTFKSWKWTARGLYF